MNEPDFSNEALQLAGQIKPILGGHRPEIQGAVLAELLSIFLAGHFVPGDEAETLKLRAKVLSLHYRLVLELTEINALRRPHEDFQRHDWN